jgi:hypothetical protein
MSPDGDNEGMESAETQAERTRRFARQFSALGATAMLECERATNGRSRERRPAAQRWEKR